uniref:Uncharacterized protein n=1 Tax=Cannabis sativa TaxID=3483 RepID=A0A803QYZ6_CANSA
MIMLWWRPYHVSVATKISRMAVLFWLVLVDIDHVVIITIIYIGLSLRNSFREVKLSFGAFEFESCFVVSKGSVLSSVESAQPNSGCLFWISYFRCPFPPRPLSHSSVVSSPHCIF